MKKLNVGSEAVYDYTFNAKMVGCSRKPQNLKSMLDLDDFDDPWSDFTKVWSRENYDHLDCEPGKVLSRDTARDTAFIAGSQIELKKGSHMTVLNKTFTQFWASK